MLKMSKKWRQVNVRPTNQGRPDAMPGCLVAHENIRSCRKDDEATWYRVKAMADRSNNDTVVDKLQGHLVFYLHQKDWDFSSPQCFKEGKQRAAFIIHVRCETKAIHNHACHPGSLSKSLAQILFLPLT